MPAIDRSKTSPPPSRSVGEGLTTPKYNPPITLGDKLEYYKPQLLGLALFACLGMLFVEYYYDKDNRIKGFENKAEFMKASAHMSKGNTKYQPEAGSLFKPNQVYNANNANNNESCEAGPRVQGVGDSRGDFSNESQRDSHLRQRRGLPGLFVLLPSSLPSMEVASYQLLNQIPYAKKRPTSRRNPSNYVPGVSTVMGHSLMNH